jgi:acetyl-CoA carboxylase biotin carboxyl carrier protein
MSDKDRPADPDPEFVRSLWAEAKTLIDRLEGSSVQRLKVAAAGYEIEIERGGATGVPVVTAAAAASAPQADGAPAAAAADGRHSIKAPLVGTFYRASQPGAKPFVEEGDIVDEGQTVAIVEAMKLMNQVHADRAGRVAEIAVADGAWVEFEQVLIYLEPVEE